MLTSTLSDDQVNQNLVCKKIVDVNRRMIHNYCEAGMIE